MALILVINIVAAVVLDAIIATAADSSAVAATKMRILSNASETMVLDEINIFEANSTNQTIRSVK